MLGNSVASLLSSPSVEKGKFHWDKKAEQISMVIKENLGTTPMLALPDSEKVFEVEYVASVVGVGAILSQKRKAGGIL